LPVLSKAFECISLKTAFVSIQVFENPRLKDEETTIDPAFTNLGLFREIRD